ncbi:MAG TPA: hypothetical protein VFS49_00025, partial [Croceibacterium sp.]|nr:hypothetical protein [Croceibacterium sp.]
MTGPRDRLPMDLGYAAPRRPRWGTLLLVVLLHLAALVLLARAFAPNFTASVIERATSLVTVAITAPPDPVPTARAEPDAGAAGAEAPKAAAREVAAPEAPLPRPSPAPRAAS